jgi:predicted NAD/FAD-binding protein
LGKLSVPRIAVVGSGISGLSCAHLLSGAHDVVLFEAGPRPGGHSRTVMVPRAGGPLPVDTGFIVYNEVNYPLLTKFFAALSVPTKPSDMSFGVRYGNGELEFCASSLDGLFAQRKNALSPRYLRMLADILRFFRSARVVFDEPGDPTLGEFVERLAPGAWFKDRFLVPMGAAIWSTPPRQMLDFPAKTFVRFFQNHGLLSVNGHHPWRTVDGGCHLEHPAAADAGFPGENLCPVFSEPWTFVRQWASSMAHRRWGQPAIRPPHRRASRFENTDQRPGSSGARIGERF